MEKQPISVAKLALQPFTTFQPDGILLVSGQDPAHANPMTISWGTFGIMWEKPVMMVMVRPTRYTWEFITNANDFTVNWMPDSFTDAVNLCGSASGRDMDKFRAGGMTPVQGSTVNAPVIAESILSLECRILYRHDLDPEQFLDPSINNMYAANDFHGLFFGEIVAAHGMAQFVRG